VRGHGVVDHLIRVPGHVDDEQKYVDFICGPDKETYFYMGNMHRYPGSFLVLGTFYPKASDHRTFWDFEEMDPTARTMVPPKPTLPEHDPLF